MNCKCDWELVIAVLKSLCMAQVTKGVPIEHIRHKRRGGYDFGSTYTLPAAKPGEMVE